MSALVALTDVALRYGSGSAGVTAIDGVDLQILDGDSLAVTGPSGSGKSSLLHLAAGLETPTAGSVSWPGLGGVPRIDPSLVGIVFQAPSLVPTLTVVENIALPLALSGLPEADSHARALGALQLLELGWLKDSLPDDLSGGQAQRVALARVLGSRPRLILADEPTGQLDSLSAEHVIRALLEVAEAIGAALVVSTHDPRIAARLHRRVTLRGGQIARTERAA